MASPRVLASIDAHASGAALRLLTGGLEAPAGRTLAIKARSLDRVHERDFLALLREPRGFDGLTLGILCEPSSADADAAVLFRRAHGFVPLPVAALVAASTIVLERGLVTPRHEGTLRIETGLGLVDLGAGLDAHARVTSVRCALGPAFVLAGGVPIDLGHRMVPVDIAWGGPFFVVVDSEAAGVPLVISALAELRRLARVIAEEVSRTLALTHPLPSGGGGLGGVVFTGPPDRADAHLRGIAVSPDGFADRAPSGASLAAILAVLQAMGLATEDGFVMEGLAGTTLSARIVGETHVGEVPAVRVTVTGRGWITGDHRWVLDDDDPLRDGFAW